MADSANKRDVTRALEIVNAVKERVGQDADDDHMIHGAIIRQSEIDELIQILTDIDARTGRRDPSKRKKPTVMRGAGRKKSPRGAKRTRSK